MKASPGFSDFVFTTTQSHVDKTQGDKEAEKMFVKIARAYDVLSNEEKRQIYDYEGLEALEEHEKTGGRPQGGGGFFGM